MKSEDFALAKLVSSALFWPETLKLKRNHYPGSALTELGAVGVFRLFWIAIRPTRRGLGRGTKQAIRRISEVQLVKFVIIICFFAIAAIYTEFSRLYILFPFAIIPLIDWFSWDANLELALRKEMKLREAEFGLSGVELRLSPEREAQMNFLAPVDPDEMDQFIELIEQKAKQAGLALPELLKRGWEERAGMNWGSSQPGSDVDAALKSYLDS